MPADIRDVYHDCQVMESAVAMETCARELKSADIKGVIFDLDGTLYRMKWFMRPLLFAILFPHGLRLSRYMKVRGMFAGKDMGSYENLMDALCCELARRTGSDAAVVRAWIFESFYPAFIRIMPLFKNTRPGVAELLSELRSRGIRRAVLSDFAVVVQRLAGLGIESGLFDSIMSSENIGVLKPGVRPFMQIAGQWGVPPGSILVVGDRDDTDGEAARSAGMQFLQVSGGRDRAPRCHSWNDIRTMLLSTGH